MARYFAATIFGKNEGGVVFYSIQPIKSVAGLRAGEGNIISEFYWSSPTRLLFADGPAPGGTDGAGVNG